MPTNSESQCYFVQLQIDSFLDGDLSATQRETFVSHVHQCQDCAQELQFAQTVHDAVLDLPLVDCVEPVLEPIHRLANGGQLEQPARGASFWTALRALFHNTPAVARYGLAAAVVAVVAVAVTPALFQSQQPEPLIAGQANTENLEEYSAEDIQQALRELNVAIDYLNQVSERTEVMIGDRFLITPLQDSLNASFERARTRRQDRLQDDPI